MCKRTVESTSGSNLIQRFKNIHSSFNMRASIQDCCCKSLSLSLRGADPLYLLVNKTSGLSLWSWYLLDTMSVHNLCWRPSEIQESQNWCWISTNIWNQFGVCMSAHSFLGSPPRSYTEGCTFPKQTECSWWSFIEKMLNIHISYTGFVKVQGHWLKSIQHLCWKSLNVKPTVWVIISTFLQTFTAAMKPDKRTHTHVPETLITITAVRPWTIICLMTPPT